VTKEQILSLSDARRFAQIDRFIDQEEARGIGPIDRAEFDGTVVKVLKARRSKGRTSRSASGGSSSETQTRRDTDQGASD
jgi:hypothetical protein